MIGPWKQWRGRHHVLNFVVAVVVAVSLVEVGSWQLGYGFPIVVPLVAVMYPSGLQLWPRRQQIKAKIWPATRR